MKKILFGTLAAATLLGAVSTASAQVRYFDADEFGSPSSVYAAPFGGWLTPADPNSSTSIGYDRNIADPNNVGG